MNLGLKQFLGSIVLLSLLSCNASFNKIAKSKNVNYKLQRATEYYNQKKYDKAQLLYEMVLSEKKGSSQYEDIYFRYAYCSYFLKEYASAENLFKTFAEYFPSSAFVEEMEYMRAYCNYKLSNKPNLDQTNTLKAMGQMQSFINTHPNSSRVADASKVIDQCRSKLEEKTYNAAMLYFDLGMYRAAGLYFNDMIDNYPDSPNSDKYKMLAIKSYYQFANKSILEKQADRFNKVINECADFKERFNKSVYLAEVENFKAEAIQKLNPSKL